jgi:hypothetical protein
MKLHVTTDVIEDPERLRALRATGLLERGTVVAGLDRLTRLATRLLDVPAGVVTLIEPDRQVFASHPRPDRGAGRETADTTVVLLLPVRRRGFRSDGGARRPYR